MLLRILSALIGIPLLIILVFVREGIPYIMGIGVISIIALMEFYRGVRKAKVADPQEWVGVASAFLFLFAAQYQFRQELQTQFFSLPDLLTVLVIISLMIELLRKNRSPIRNLGVTLTGVVYVGWLFSYLVAINSVPSPTGEAIHLRFIPVALRYGGWLVLYITFSTWASDTSAYFIGRKWGKNKLAPHLSPGKTWEGFCAGVVGSILMSVLMSRPLEMPIPHAIALGMSIAIAGVIGDLAESAIKRELGIKDFGSIMPGHGGILDRFDSLLFTAPLFYYYITAIAK